MLLACTWLLVYHYITCRSIIWHGVRTRQSHGTRIVHQIIALAKIAASSRRLAGIYAMSVWQSATTANARARVYANDLCSSLSATVSSLRGSLAKLR